MGVHNPDSEPLTKQLFSPEVRIILSIVIAVVIILFLYMLFKDFFSALFAKTHKVTATLVSKVAEPYVTQKVFASGNADMSGGGSGVGSGVAEKGLDYFFTFELEDGKMITLTGSKTMYDVALENGKGILVYKGKNLISFDGPTEGTRVKNDQNSYEFVGLNKKL